MANDDARTTKLFQDCLDSLVKREGKETTQKFLDSIDEIGEAGLFAVMLAILDEQDLQAIDDIDDEQEAQVEIQTRFKNHTGMTPQEFYEKFQDAVRDGIIGMTND